MVERRSNVLIRLPNGTSAFIEATHLGGEESVAFDKLSFETVSSAIEGISDSLIGSLKKVKPTKAAVEFGVEVAVESGTLTALFVKGEGKANIKVTLEWAEKSG